MLALTRERLAAIARMRLTVLSAYMKRELVQAGLDERRVAAVPPFIHGLDPAARPDGPPCVLFAGRLAEAKGVADATEAWRRSALALPLVFAGTGPRRAMVEAAGFEVLGWVPHERLGSLYRRARAVLMPSRWQEPFGIVGLEAASGTPVVAWDSGGVREWHRGPGLVPWGDVEAQARELRTAVERRAEPPVGFDAEALVARTEALYAIHP